MKRTKVLRKAIMERRAVAVPGCHDALSAKVIEKAGFEAIQVSGYGLAGAFLAKPDVGLVRMKDVLDLTWNIAQAVSHPGHGRHRHRRRQRRQRGLDHRAPRRHGRRRHEHRGPGLPQALRPHGRQGSHLGRGDGREDPGLRRRPRQARQGLHHQRPDRRLRRDGPGRGHQALQHLPRSRRRPGLHRRHQEPGRHREGGQVDQGPAVGQPHGRHHRHEDRAHPHPRARRRWASAASPSPSPPSWSSTRR